MPKARCSSWLLLAAFQMTPSLVLGQTGVSSVPASSAASSAEPVAKLPFLVGVAIDDVGISAADLEKSVATVLAIFEALPDGSMVAVASFRGDERIVLPPTSDRALLARTLSRLKPGPTGVALPDGLFDTVEYLSRVDAGARAILLVSAGRMGEGDLEFEDPLNAATNREIPIVALGLGQGDGKLLRRIARISSGEYVRLEVADPVMLAHALFPPPVAAAPVTEPPAPLPAPDSSVSLLGAAAIFLAFGGLLILGTVVLLVRRLSSRPAAAKARPAPPPPVPNWVTKPMPMSVQPLETEEEALERTLVVNASPTLRALSGPGTGKNFRLAVSGQTSLGRSRGNDIVVPEDGASAHHCRIDREGDSYVLHDLGSTNGTWVNGTRTDRAVLQHGDRLKVGGTVFAVGLFGDRT